MTNIEVAVSRIVESVTPSLLMTFTTKPRVLMNSTKATGPPSLMISVRTGTCSSFGDVPGI